MCATARYGSIITELKGKIGGQTFQGGKYGKVVKNTNRWIKIRGTYIWSDDSRKKSTLAFVSQAWQGLTDAQRSDWGTAAASFPATNRFGDVYTPSGFQIWCKFNFNREAMGNDYQTVAPVPPIFPDTSLIEFGADDSTSVVVKNLIYPAADFKVAVYMAKQMSQGRAVAPGGYKFIGYYAIPVDGVVDVTADYEKRFGALTVRKKLWGYIRIIHIPTGVPTNLKELFTIVVTS